MAEGRGLRVISGGRAVGAPTAAVPPEIAAGAESETLAGEDLTSGAVVGPPALPSVLPSVLADLYSKYGGSVYARCHYLLQDRSKSEDAMQDVFAKALVNLAGFRAEASPLTWLTKIATNHCLNLLRADRAAWRREYEDEERARVARVEQAGATLGPRLFEDRQAVRRLLAQVDLETQAAAIHYYVDEMTLEEVAAALGRSVPTVRKRLETFAARGQGESRS